MRTVGVQRGKNFIFYDQVWLVSGYKVNAVMSATGDVGWLVDSLYDSMLYKIS